MPLFDNIPVSTATHVKALRYCCKSENMYGHIAFTPCNMSTHMVDTLKMLMSILLWAYPKSTQEEPYSKWSHSNNSNGKPESHNNNK